MQPSLCVEVRTMYEILSKLDSGTLLALCGMLVGVIAIVGKIAVAITKVMVSHYHRTQLDELEATLKMEMVQRGMTADDIKKVLESKMASGRDGWTERRGGLKDGQTKAVAPRESLTSERATEYA